ncbi:MAG: hypothetical protein RIC14_07810 [Filomicrobium sp.]
MNWHPTGCLLIFELLDEDSGMTQHKSMKSNLLDDAHAEQTADQLTEADMNALQDYCTEVAAEGGELGAVAKQILDISERMDTLSRRLDEALES